MPTNGDEQPGRCACSCGCCDVGPWRTDALMPLCDHCYGPWLRSRHYPKVRDRKA